MLKSSFLLLVPTLGIAQISNLTVSTTATQATISYTAPIAGACSIKVADMNRAISIAGAVKSGSLVTVTTTAPHGLSSGATIYIEGSSSYWNGWQTITAVTGPTTLLFTSTTGSGSVVGGNVGVLVDDVNPRLFTGADQDSRAGNANNGNQRIFVIGHRSADVSLNGNRYSRALQVASRHHFTLTCGTQKIDQEYTTQNIPLGSTYNEGLPADRTHPGQYSYPTVQWNNPAQALIDPLTGIRSFRATSPSGMPSGTQTFQKALDLNAAWGNPSGAITSGGSATFSGTCTAASGCPLLLRADNLQIYGGATYEADGDSLDWVTVQVTNASVGACTGDACKVEACLTVDGVSCASSTREVVMSAVPATYTFGSQSLMDLWQNSGPPSVSRVDASSTSGTVNYTAATRQVTVASGGHFNVRWGAGSRIAIAGAEYTVASVQNENQLTLSAGPGGNLNGAPYSANNFGVLIWKKTTGSPLTIGYTTFNYGSSGLPYWDSYSVNSCGPAVSVNSVTGYDCFVDHELFWVSQDGTQVHDLGPVATSFYQSAEFPEGGICGSSSQPNQFDPANGDTWYCLSFLYFDPTWESLVKVQYNGSHATYAPAQLCNGHLCDCNLNNNTQPCLKFTAMEPNKSTEITTLAKNFSTEYASSGFVPMYWFFGGISPDGHALLFTREGNQDTKSWHFMYTLGDRSPNSVQPVAVSSSYRHAPLSWCVNHASGTVENQWAMFSCNSMPGNTAYAMTLTSSLLSSASGGTGGLNPCPTNTLGVTGQVCTAITVRGEPTRISDGSFLQNSQVGDLMTIDSETLRIVLKIDSMHLVVQRGFLGFPASHSGTALTMTCGVTNPYSATAALWDYRNDPMGQNLTRSTILSDWDAINGHGTSGSGIYLNAGLGWYLQPIGQACPPSAGLCYEVRYGNAGTAQNSAVNAVALDPPFAGVYPTPSDDSHPGPCIGTWCLDAHPFYGGGYALNRSQTTMGTASAPFAHLTGQLWKISGSGTVLDRKFFPTMSFSGRWPMVDVSGPASALTPGAGDSYKYCVALKAGECYSGSAAGDVYVNTPYVSVPYCPQAQFASQVDDQNAICIADMGSATPSIVQAAVMNTDLTGAGLRRIQTGYARWNQQYTYWNVQASPNGVLMFSQSRWLEGVRHEDLVSMLPPYPAPDGVSRNSFIPVPIQAAPPSGVTASTAMVEFGYGENGDPSSFFCTSRQEACVAVQGSVNTATPFYFEQSESYSPAPCAFGCTITVPAISQHVVYYRVKFLNAAGQVVYTAPTQASTVE